VLEIPPSGAWARWTMLGSDGSTDVGITGPDKVKGKILLLPPDIRAGARWLLCCAFPHGRKSALLRTFFKDGDPKPGVDRVKESLRVYPSVRLPTASNEVRQYFRQGVQPQSAPVTIRCLSSPIASFKTSQELPLTLTLWAYCRRRDREGQILQP